MEMPLANWLILISLKYALEKVSHITLGKRLLIFYKLSKWNVMKDVGIVLGFRL